MPSCMAMLEPLGPLAVAVMLLTVTVGLSGCQVLPASLSNWKDLPSGVWGAKRCRLRSWPLLRRSWWGLPELSTHFSTLASYLVADDHMLLSVNKRKAS